MMNIDDIIEDIKVQQIQLLDFWFVDLLGSVKSVLVPVKKEDTPKQLKDLLQKGTLCDSAALIPPPLLGESSYKTHQRNIRICPDLQTYLPLPWTIDKHNIRSQIKSIAKQYSVDFKMANVAKARFICQIEGVDSDNKCFSSRDKLKAYIKSKLEPDNWQYIVGPELEFHFFEGEGVLDQGGYLDTEPNTVKATHIRETISLLCEAVNIKVECHHHEVGRGQQEIDFEKADALTMADNIITYKMIVHDVARLFGVRASFMPKPFNDSHGNGMHVHQSIWQGDKNLFFDKKRKHFLSDFGVSFTAGLLTYSSEITAITNQWVNSYKRIVPRFEAPVYIAWGPANRSTLIRIPGYYPKGNSTIRVEYRSPDPACNPYLTFLVMLVAGIEGVDNDLTLPLSVEEDIFSMPEVERQDRGIGTLPANLGLSLEAMERGAIVKKALGEAFMSDFLKIKQAEWSDFNKYVTALELQQFLKLGI